MDEKTKEILNDKLVSEKMAQVIATGKEHGVIADNNAASALPNNEKKDAESEHFRSIDQDKPVSNEDPFKVDRQYTPKTPSVKKEKGKGIEP